MMDAASLYEQILAQDGIEWIGLLTGLVYVVLAAYEKPSCWIFGILSCAAIAWKSFFEYSLIADGFLQIFYIIIGAIGLHEWLSGRVAQREKPIVKSPWRHHLIAVWIAGMLSFPVSWFLIHVADARFGYPDTLLALLSVYATVLLVKKDVHNWVYWIIIDMVYVLIFGWSDAILFATLYLIFALVSVFGFFKWRRQMVDDVVGGKESF